jgi:O-antigen/teichoic acid export membrane protein
MNRSFLSSIRSGFRAGRVTIIVGTLFIRGSSAGLQFVLGIILGRVLGPAGLGIYYLYISWTNLIGIVGSFGLPTLTLRTTAVFSANEDFETARWFWRRSVFIAIVITGGIAAAVFVVRDSITALFAHDSTSSNLVTFVALAAIPFAVLSLCAAALKAQRRPQLGLLLEFAFAPALLLLFTLFVHFCEFSLQASSVLAVHVSALFLAAVVTVIVVYRSFSSASGKSGRDDIFRFRHLVPQAFRYWLINLLTLFTGNLPFMLLPLFSTETEIGLYGVANRLISLATLILLALSSIYSPLFASAYAEKNAGSLRVLLRQTQVYSLLAYTPLWLLFFFKSDWVLGLFGNEFVVARPYLLALGFGQLVNSATGLVTFFNLMTENEKFEIKASVIALMIAASLSLTLIKNNGAVAMAVAMATALALKNILSFIRARQTLKVLEKEQAKFKEISRRAADSQA